MNRKKIFFVLAALAGLFIFSLFLPRFFFLNKHYTEFDPNSEKIIIGLKGTIIENPVKKFHPKNQRGTEVFCHDNSEADYLLVLDDQYEDLENPPTYLWELWTSYNSYIPNEFRLKNKNVLPVFHEKSSFLKKLLARDNLSLYINKHITAQGNLISDRKCENKFSLTNSCSYKQAVNCKIFIISSVTN
jgi:hypothetical protein